GAMQALLPAKAEIGRDVAGQPARGTGEKLALDPVPDVTHRQETPDSVPVQIIQAQLRQPPGEVRQLTTRVRRRGLLEAGGSPTGEAARQGMLQRYLPAVDPGAAEWQSRHDGSGELVGHRNQQVLALAKEPRN